MSDTDSFIEEVTEEVRRDRLYRLMHKYGWIGVAAVLLIVGGTAWNEYTKATERTKAEANGDALIAALEKDDPADRVQVLQGVAPQTEGAEIARAFMLSAEQFATGDVTSATATLDGINLSGDGADDIYGQLAALKAAMLSSDDDDASRRIVLETMAEPGKPFSLIASEQLALMDLSEGNKATGLDRLQAIIQDSEATAGLRRRVAQLIVALGETPADVPTDSTGQ